jgi:hypothetical protein
MDEPVPLLTVEFLRWIAARPRTYAEAMEAWRSNCPRHTVWEDALINGLIQFENGVTMNQCAVIVTPRGRAILDSKLNAQGDAPLKTSQTHC